MDPCNAYFLSLVSITFLHNTFEMDELTVISRGLYEVVGANVGQEQIIEMRRMIMNLKSDVDRSIWIYDEKNEEEIYSGSRAEGFRFATSDHDTMLVRRGIRVIFSPSQYLASNLQQTLLIAETNCTKPGFSLLRLITQPNTDEQLIKSLVRYGVGNYVSSTYWVNTGLTAKLLHRSFIHGPCISDTLGSQEVDFAESIKSEYMPDVAKNNFVRLYRSRKITRETLICILRGGCHYVAIASKRPVHHLLEWRISFSSAEKIIISSFNHIQFLCYGLLKIFLREAIDSDHELKGLLCSYFMKTAVFWMSLDSSAHWAPDTLLVCFWKCFQLLLQWVDNGYCPNFFIPENNMFADKFTAQQLTDLLEHLRYLYSEGYRCLFRCPSISDLLKAFIQVPPMVYCILSDLTRKSNVELQLIRKIWGRQPFAIANNMRLPILHNIEHSRYNNPFQISCVSIWRSMLLCEILIETGSYYVGNERKSNTLLYHQGKAAISILKTCTADATLNLLYCAIYHYRLCRYIDALHMIRTVKRRLRHPCIMYPWNLDRKKYAAAGGETRPFLDMMRTVIAFPVFSNADSCIPELCLEHYTDYSFYTTAIPPIVCANFIAFLCYHKLGRQTAQLLQIQLTLLLYDDGYHINERDRAISWEILGICQEMSGDYHGAFHSYYTALQQSWCPFKDASVVRMLLIAHRLLSENR